MTETPRIIIIAGPDRGRSFEPEEELIHLGKGDENQVVIDDPSLADHHASIVSRNGRYAIYTPSNDSVEVDGSSIPSERWVWLPETAKIQLGQRTTFIFTCKDEEIDEVDNEAATASDGEAGSSSRGSRSAVASPLKSRSRSKSKKKKRRKRSSKRNQEVAQFITGQGGDTLVKLGEDGHMPELMLAEQVSTKTKEKKDKQSNPALLYVALAVSVLFSMAMLFIDTEIGSSTAQQKNKARQSIKKYYGNEKKIQPYEQLLRDAELAYFRRDFSSERRNYRQVLNLLNSEDNNRFTGLTGTPEDDEQLKKAIGTLLRN